MPPRSLTKRGTNQWESLILRRDVAVGEGEQEGELSEEVYMLMHWIVWGY